MQGVPCKFVPDLITDCFYIDSMLFLMMNPTIGVCCILHSKRACLHDDMTHWKHAETVAAAIVLQ